MSSQAKWKFWKKSQNDNKAHAIVSGQRHPEASVDNRSPNKATQVNEVTPDPNLNDQPIMDNAIVLGTSSEGEARVASSATQSKESTIEEIIANCER